MLGRVHDGRRSASDDPSGSCAAVPAARGEPVGLELVSGVGEQLAELLLQQPQSWPTSILNGMKASAFSALIVG